MSSAAQLESTQLPSYVLGRRIVIFGATGSGKSTLADALGEALGLAVLHLDNIRHATGFDSTPWDEMRRQMETWVESHPEGWICEGNYSRVRDVTVSRADTLISLDLPWRVSFARLFKRTLARAWDQKPLYQDGGPHETWRLSFFSRRSILLWSITNHQRRKRTTADAFASRPAGALTYRLSSSRDVARLIASAQTGRPPATPPRS